MNSISLSIILTGLFFIACTSPASKDNVADKPNVIIILTEDMGYGDVSIYGGKLVSTPHIDRMAQEGTRFQQCYSAAPISSPSRAGFLTGVHPAKWNITSYLQHRKGNRMAEMADFLTAEAPTLPRTMKAAGYKTAHFGKWHLGGGRDVYNAPGFKEYGYDEYSSTYESPDPDPLLTATDWVWSIEDSIKRWNRTAYYVDKTLDFLKRNGDKSCFVNLWPDDLHTPWIGNMEEQEVFPDGIESENNFRTVLTEYDKQIGRLLQGIRDLKLTKNTIVIFTSDNGPAPNLRESRAGNFRGCKASLYEGGLRVPFIIWDTKGLICRGVVDESTVLSALDMFPSLCKIAGVAVPEGYNSDGVDMSKALLGIPQKREKAIFWEYRRKDINAFPKAKDNDSSPNVAVRKGDWKLLINDDGSDVMLYNMRVNPLEEIDISEMYPNMAKELKELALNWRMSLPKLVR